MEVEPTLRRYLVSELRVAADGLVNVNESRLHEGPFYFSAVYAAFGRAMNVQYEREVGFLHFVTNQAHTVIAQRVAVLTQGSDPSVGISVGFFAKLAEHIRSLADRIEFDEPYLNELMNISEMAFITTGNGFYLHRTRGVGTPM